jgi:hypothetical protein
VVDLWAICGQLWVNCGHLWAICGRLWAICGRFVGDCGRLWAICGRFVGVMQTFPEFGDPCFPFFHSWLDSERSRSRTAAWSHLASMWTSPPSVSFIASTRRQMSLRTLFMLFRSIRFPVSCRSCVVETRIFLVCSSHS